MDSIAEGSESLLEPVHAFRPALLYWLDNGICTKHVVNALGFRLQSNAAPSCSWPHDIFMNGASRSARALRRAQLSQALNDGDSSAVCTGKKRSRRSPPEIAEPQARTPGWRTEWKEDGARSYQAPLLGFEAGRGRVRRVDAGAPGRTRGRRPPGAGEGKRFRENREQVHRADLLQAFGFRGAAGGSGAGRVNAEAPIWSREPESSRIRRTSCRHLNSESGPGARRRGVLHASGCGAGLIVGA